jgi:poly(3-hydroxybutyrate) depolymerase
VEHIVYRAHDGTRRPALLLLPQGYQGQPIPLVISPHGRNTLPRADAARWGHLPFEGGFAVICPGGEGRRLPLYSWGAPGQIADLARMPAIAAAHGVNVERGRVYAVGTSMGGQETLLLVARYPHLLAGAVAFDPATDMASRYRQFGRLPGGATLQRLARFEIGGTPTTNPGGYAARSPVRYARAIAASGVPLQIYWSQHDGVILGQQRLVARFVGAINHKGRSSCLLVYRGDWHHADEVQSWLELGAAVTRLGLLTSDLASSPVSACERPSATS